MTNEERAYWIAERLKEAPVLLKRGVDFDYDAIMEFMPDEIVVYAD